MIYLNLGVQYVIWPRRMLTRNARKGCVYCTVQLVLPLGLYGSHIKMSVSNCALIMLLGFRHTLIFHLYRYKPIFCAVLLIKYTLKSKNNGSKSVCVCVWGGICSNNIEKAFWFLPRTFQWIIIKWTIYSKCEEHYNNLKNLCLLWRNYCALERLYGCQMLFMDAL